MIKQFLGHLHTINHHKWLVTRDCIRVGLISQGLKHDLSKYAPIEFFAGVKYYEGGKDGFIGAKMPKRFVAEMVIDRISASRNYQKENYTCRSAWEYYARAKDVYVMNDETRFLLEYLLKMTAAKGEAYTFSYMRKKLLRHRYRDYHVVNGKLVLD